MNSDKTHQPFLIKQRLQSFRYAFQGLIFLFKTEHNARIHAVATTLAIFAGFYFNIKSWEWLWIIVSIGLVFITELINSAIENLADVVSPGQNEKIGKVKDMAAAAVLVAAILALLIGCIIFIPKIVGLPS